MVSDYREFYADHFGISNSSKFALGANKKSFFYVKTDFRKKIFLYFYVFLFLKPLFSCTMMPTSLFLQDKIKFLKNNIFSFLFEKIDFSKIPDPFFHFFSKKIP